MNEARERAIAWLNQAIDLVRTDPQTAYRLSCSAVMVDPSFADGWVFLGCALADLRQWPAAIAAFRKALDVPMGPEPGDMNPTLRHKALYQLGHWLMHNGEFDEAMAVTDRVIALNDDPAVDVPEQNRAFAHTNKGLIASHMYRPAVELASARRGYEMAPDNPQCELGLAFALLFQGQYAEGLKHFTARFPLKLPGYLNLPYPAWTGDEVPCLLVLCEQGLGDTLSFARFVAAAADRVGRVLFVAHPPLVTLLARTFAWHERIEVRPMDTTIPEADAWCSVFNLPVALGLTDAEIEGFTWSGVNVKPVEDRSWLTPGATRHIAIAWAGNPGNEIDRHRTVPLAEFFKLFRVPGVALYSVQVGEAVAELHASGAAGLIKDMSPWIRDARDTAGILNEMDLVIACESFVAHLAGAMSMECWVLLSRLGRDWRVSPFRPHRDALWCPKHRLFRQGESRLWEPVFERVVDALGDWAAR